MKKSKKAAGVLTILAFIIAVATTVTGILLYLDKKRKDDEEIEHYLDCSIQ